LNELVRIDRLLDPFREQDPEHRVWRTCEDRARSRETAERCEQLLAAITQIERRCEKDLIERRDSAAVLVHDLQSAARASRAYGVADELPGTHFDISCES
jgi:hypothetical protein